MSQLETIVLIGGLLSVGLSLAGFVGALFTARRRRRASKSITVRLSADERLNVEFVSSVSDEEIRRAVRELEARIGVANVKRSPAH